MGHPCESLTPVGGHHRHGALLAAGGDVVEARKQNSHNGRSLLLLFNYHAPFLISQPTRAYPEEAHCVYVMTSGPTRAPQRHHHRSLPPTRSRSRDTHAVGALVVVLSLQHIPQLHLTPTRANVLANIGSPYTRRPASHRRRPSPQSKALQTWQPLRNPHRDRHRHLGCQSECGVCLLRSGSGSQLNATVGSRNLKLAGADITYSRPYFKLLSCAQRRASTAGAQMRTCSGRRTAEGL